MAGISSRALKPSYVQNRNQYNGKELQSKEFGDGTGLEEYDFGSRRYDAAVGRWRGIDSKAELYFGTSPYVYALNQPTNAIDVDGNLVIFINGMHTGSGGKPAYWRAYEKQVLYYHNDHDDYHNWSGPIFGMVETRAFDKEVMDHLDDHNALYKDGSSGGIMGLLLHNSGNPYSRTANGYDEGKKDAASIVANLARDKNGNIIESIKVVTHSMGGAFAKGYILAILEYVRENNIQGVVIAFEADFAPFQPTNQAAIKTKNMGPTIQYSHSDDLVAGDDEMLGADKGDTSSDKEKSHPIVTFSVQDILSLPSGSYKVVDGKIVKQ